MTFIEILNARQRIAPFIRRTPLVASTWLSDHVKAPVSLKLESQQLTNSFKSRGAFNAVIARRERGQLGPQLVTASAGNHGRALAAAAERFGCSLVVFAPRDAPATKLEAIRRHGATLNADAADYDETERLAKQFAASTGAVFISPYSDPDVIAGAGTIAPEIFEDAPAIDTLIVPIGGGGLISGVAVAARHINPACRIVGVEAAASCPFQTSVHAGRLVEISPGPTLADGLAGNPDPETITFALIEQYVDDIVTVREEALAAAIVGLVDHEHVITEGAGAAAVAAVVSRQVREHGRAIAAIVTGSNIDRQKLAALLRTA